MKNKKEKDKIVENLSPNLKKWEVPKIIDISVLKTKHGSAGSLNDGGSYPTSLT